MKSPADHLFPAVASNGKTNLSSESDSRHSSFEGISSLRQQAEPTECGLFSICPLFYFIFFLDSPLRFETNMCLLLFQNMGREMSAVLLAM